MIAARFDLGGDVVVDVIRDAVGDHPLALADAFPGTPAQGWDAVRIAHPETVGAQGRWRLPVNVVLVRTPDAAVLIDAGVGAAGTAAAEWLGVAGRLGVALRELAMAPEDLDCVVLTHLHRDHVGWLADPRSGRASFVRARHIVRGADWIVAEAGARPAHLQAAFASVEGEGLVDVDGPLPGGLEFVPLPGHTPGHAGVLITGGERRLLFAGDTFNHPLQLTEPEVPSGADEDRAVAAATRRRLLRRVAEEQLTVVGAHLPQPAGW